MAPVMACRQAAQAVQRVLAIAQRTAHVIELALRIPQEIDPGDASPDRAGFREESACRTRVAFDSMGEIGGRSGFRTPDPSSVNAVQVARSLRSQASSTPLRDTHLSHSCPTGQAASGMGAFYVATETRLAARVRRCLSRLRRPRQRPVRAHGARRGRGRGWLRKRRATGQGTGVCRAPAEGIDAVLCGPLPVESQPSFVIRLLMSPR